MDLVLDDDASPSSTKDTFLRLNGLLANTTDCLVVVWKPADSDDDDVVVVVVNGVAT